MRSTDFIDNSNARARQMERINALNNKPDEEYEAIKCSKCATIPSEKQRLYSLKHFDAVLCWGHQPHREEVNKNE